MATTAGSVTTVKITSLVNLALFIGRPKIPRTSGMTITNLKKLQIMDGTLSSNLTIGPRKSWA